MARGATSSLTGSDAVRLTDWTHKDGTSEHEVDPKYNGSGWMNGETPSYWVCHTCRKSVLLGGAKPPITEAPVKAAPTPEPPMSSQP